MIRYFMIILLLPFLVVAQDIRKLSGVAIADQSSVDFLTVINTGRSIEVKSDDNGNFMIDAASGDVLEFSSPTFNVFTHVVSAQDFKEDLFVVRMVPSAILLDEVSLTGLTGSLAIDSKKTEVMLFSHMFDPAAINLNVVNDNPLGNLNFVAMFGMLYNTIFPAKKSYFIKDHLYKDSKSSVQHRKFSSILMETHRETFFTDTLKIPKERLVMFLHSCNKDAKRYLLDPKNETELIEFLKSRYLVYELQYKNNNDTQPNQEHHEN